MILSIIRSRGSFTDSPSRYIAVRLFRLFENSPCFSGTPRSLMILIPFRFLKPHTQSVQTLSALVVAPLLFSSSSGDRRHLRRRFNWKYVHLDLVAVDECHDYLHPGQPILARKVHCSLRVTKITGFTKLPCPGSGALKIKPTLDVLQNDAHAFLGLKSLANGTHNSNGVVTPR